MIAEKRYKTIMDKYLDGIYNLSPIESKLYFSKSPCRCCGSTLEGYRRTFTGTVGKAHNNKRAKLSCCLDCFSYLFE